LETQPNVTPQQSSPSPKKASTKKSSGNLNNSLKEALDAAMMKEEKKTDNKVAQVEKAEQKSVSADDSIEEVVFILQKDNKVKKVKVKTAIQDLNNIEITEGVKEGDKVITGPYSIVSKMLKDGNLVTIVEKDKLFEEKKKE